MILALRLFYPYLTSTLPVRSLDHADIFAAAIRCTDTRIVPTPEAKHFPQISRYR